MTHKRYHLLWILALAAGLRLLQIGAPPIGRHAWRQSDTAGVARNFHQQGYRLLYPQIDWDIPGYVEMEFPIYSWTVALTYRLVGETEAAARLLSLLGALAVVLLLYRIVDRILGQRAALWAAFLVAVLPMSLFFGRAIMPESWMLAASAAAIYWFLLWTEEGRWRHWFLSAAAAAVACLLKLTSLYLGLPLLWLAWRRYGRRTLLQWPVWLHAVVVSVPVAAWYRHAYRLGQEYGASFNILTAAGVDKWGQWSLLLTPDFYNQVFLGTLGARMLTWAGFLVFLVGLFLSRRSRNERLFDVWLLAVVIVLVLANAGSYHHDYYSLPLLLPAAAFMGKTFARGWEKRRWLLAVAALLTVGLSGYRYAGYLREERAVGAEGEPLNEDVAIARRLAAASSAGDRVISCNASNPVWLYLAERRGWGRDCARLDKAELLDLTSAGAQLLVGRTADFEAASHRRARRFLETFYDVRRSADGAWLADLDSARGVDDIAWRRTWSQRFRGRSLPKDWRFDSGTWRLRARGLHGFKTRDTATALATPAFAGCDLCRVRAALGVVRARGGKSPRATLEAWRQDDDTYLSVILAPEQDKIWFQERENGVLIKSVMLPRTLEMGRVYQLEVRFDLYEFELLLDGESISTLPSRFSETPHGGLVVHARSAEVRLEHLRVLEPEPRTPAAD